MLKEKNEPGLSWIAAAFLSNCLYRAFRYFSFQETTASGAVVFQSPRVKSGNSTGLPPWAME